MALTDVSGAQWYHLQEPSAKSAVFKAAHGWNSSWFAPWQCFQSSLLLSQHAVHKRTPRVCSWLGLAFFALYWAGFLQGPSSGCTLQLCSRWSHVNCAKIEPTKPTHHFWKTSLMKDVQMSHGRPWCSLLHSPAPRFEYMAVKHQSLPYTSRTKALMSFLATCNLNPITRADIHHSRPFQRLVFKSERNQVRVY